MPLLFLLLLLPILSSGQCYNRYTQEIFSTYQLSSDIPYGQSINHAGDTVTLLMDFYEPTADPITKRPLVILLHGPNLVEGSKSDDNTVAISERLARRGYAVAAVNYRKAYSMQQLLTKKELFEATLLAAQDAKAAVRFFREDLQNNHLYPFDSTMIWLGGIGGGSMAAQMAVYLDDTLEVSTEWQAIISANGGLEGNSGHPNYSSQVRGVINLSGAVLDTNWMANQSEALINIHGDMDDYFPYAFDSLFAYTHNNNCNGHHELCYKRLNEVTFVQTHNSHANDNDFTVFAANQNGDIPAQFAAGVRALGIKLYYTSSFFCGSGTHLYAYHGDPILGCIRFSTIGDQIRDFLNNNPNEFLFITVEGSASNSEIDAGFSSAGLTPFLYQHSFGADWPTLGDLIASGQRLIVMTDNSGPQLPGYHHMWTFMQDTEYNFQSTNDFNCNYLRGNTNSDLFLLNHFLTIGSPQPLSAASTNDWQLVLDRARQCRADRGLHPNLLYIDFFDSGDVFRAADTLNRIGEDFPAVHGSANIQAAATQMGLLSELYTMNGQGYAAFDSNWGDSASAFIADFMTRHYPCEMSCAMPVSQIIGPDSIWKDSTYIYSINNNQGATYQWFTTDSTYNSHQSIALNTQDSSGLLLLSLIERSQYGCIYDTISTSISIFVNTSIQLLENNTFVKVFPNPSTGKIWLEFDAPIQENIHLQIYDSQGRLLRDIKPIISHKSIDLQGLSSGLYVLKLMTKGGIYTKLLRLE